MSDPGRRVMKFGGTSVATAERVRAVAELVRAALPSAPLVVVSAMGRTTRALLAAAERAEAGTRGSDGGRAPWSVDPDPGGLSAARDLVAPVAEAHRALANDLFSSPPEALVETIDREIEELEQLLHGVALLRELSPRAADAIVARGELLSSAIVTAFLRESGVPAELFDVRRVMRTDDRFGAARPLQEALTGAVVAELGEAIRPGAAVVTQGFIGATEAGITTTLGREGSDYSAALLGAALGVEEVQIWTDVSGVLTADPTTVPAARTIPVLSFAEARALTALGAKVLHPATLRPAIEAGIPVTVRNTTDPAGPFTTIGASPGERAVAGVASRGRLELLDLAPRRGDTGAFLSQVFESLGRHRADAELISKAESGLRVLVPASAVSARLLDELGEVATIERTGGRALVGVVGERLRSHPGVAGRIVGAVEAQPLDVVSLGGDHVTLSLVVAEDDAESVVRVLHRALFEVADGEEPPA